MKTEFDARAKLRPSFDGRWLAGATALIAMAFLMMLPPIRLDPAYHQFSDQRALFKIPNFWNVASNLPFVAVGPWGLRVVFRNRVGRGVGIVVARIQRVERHLQHAGSPAGNPSPRGRATRDRPKVAEKRAGTHDATR